ncbi:MAG: helix-turn-helix transcriptional regulator [Sphingomonadaceae bacterium]
MAPKPMTPWGARILELLDGRPISWLAREADVKRSTLNAAISGTLPSVDKALRIARALGTTVEWLMTGEEAAADCTPRLPLNRRRPRPQTKAPLPLPSSLDKGGWLSLLLRRGRP